MNEEHLAKVNSNSKSKEKIQLSKWREQTCTVLAPKQQLPPQMARTGVLSPVGADQRRSATPTACATSAEMALGLRQTSHSAGHWRFLPPFFFCGCWCKFFFNAPLVKQVNRKKRAQVAYRSCISLSRCGRTRRSEQRSLRQVNTDFFSAA